jgi:hypothetical protein
MRFRAIASVVSYVSVRGAARAWWALSPTR